MTRACRQTCSGDGFDHAEIIMSIARAGELLRCPICQHEAEIPQPPPDNGDATPGVATAETPL